MIPNWLNPISDAKARALFFVTFFALFASTLSALTYNHSWYTYQTASNSAWQTDVPGYSRAVAAIDASSMTTSNKTTLKSLLATAYNNSKTGSGQPRTSPASFTSSSGSLSVTISNTFNGGPFPGPNYYDAYGLGEDAVTVYDITYLYSTNVLLSGPDAPAIIYYTLTTTTAGSGSVTAGGTYASGTVRTISATPATGHYFTGWSNAASGSTNPLGITVDANKTLTANFSPTNYTLTTNAAGSGSVTAGGTQAYGTSKSITASPSTGYTFTGWSGAASGSTNPITITFDGNKTLTANFTPNNYTLTTAVNGSGSVTAGGTQAYGTTKAITAAPSTGYSFTGWSGSASGSTNPLTVTFDSNKSITANFAINSYTLTTAVNGGGSVTAGGTQNYGTTKAITASPWTGYTFSGWSGAATGSTNPLTVTFDSSKSITANFTPNNNTVTLNKSPAAGGTVTGGGTHATGADFSISATAATGYSFAYWTFDWSGYQYNSPSFVTSVNRDRSFTAVFTPNDYTLATSVNGSGSVTSGATQAFGTTRAITASPATGHRFTGWSGAASGSTNPLTVTFDSNKSITANFAANNYTLTTAVNGNGSISTGSTETYGTVRQISATADPGYSFTGWSGAATGTANPVSITFDSNKTLTANFTANNYTLTTSATTGGSVTAGGTQAYGTTKAITASPSTGYVFSSWSGAATGNSNPVTITFNANKSLTANFSPINYTLTTTIIGSGSVTAGATQAYGTTRAITASPATGYTFTGWSGAATGTTNPVTITFDSNKTLTANFTVNNYTLTTAASGSGSVTAGGTQAYGTTKSITASPSTGHSFTGWSGASTSTTNPLTVTFDANKTLTGNFAVNNYTLTTDTAGNGSVTSGGTQAYGTTKQITATPATGYRFSGWSGAASGTTNPLTVTFDGNKTLTANFTINSYTLTTAKTGNGWVSTGSTETYGTVRQISATADVGYTFTGWSGAASGNTTPVSITFDADKTLTATFTPNNYTLTTSATTGGSVTTGGTQAYGTTKAITATPATGYSFTGWSGAASGNTNPVTITFNADKSLTANFTPNNYTLTTSATTGGSVTAGGTYPYGTVRSITATPTTGYTFQGWSGAATGSTNPVGITVDANKSLTANFLINSYNVTATAAPVAGGSITGAGSFNHGSTATLTAVPASGYSFTGWTGDASGSNNPVSLTVDSAKAVTANFSLIPPPTASITASPLSGWAPLASTLTWTSSGADSVSVSGPSFTSSSLSGSQPLSLAVGTFVYSITATNVNGSSTSSVTIEVEPATFTLTTSVSGSGSVTAGGTYPRPNPSVTAVTIIASPSATSMFSSWSGDTSGTVNTLNGNGTASLYVPMTANRSIVAAFSPKLAQSITFTNPGTRSFKDGPFAVTASASSGLPVTIAVTSGPATIAGNVVTLTGEGNVILTASQSGNNTYLAATPVSIAFEATNPLRTRLQEDEGDSSINDGESEERNLGN